MKQDWKIQLYKTGLNFIILIQLYFIETKPRTAQCYTSSINHRFIVMCHSISTVFIHFITYSMFSMKYMSNKTHISGQGWASYTDYRANDVKGGWTNRILLLAVLILVHPSITIELIDGLSSVMPLLVQLCLSKQCWLWVTNSGPMMKICPGPMS